MAFKKGVQLADDVTHSDALVIPIRLRDLGGKVCPPLRETALPLREFVRLQQTIHQAVQWNIGKEMMFDVDLPGHAQDAVLFVDGIRWDSQTHIADQDSQK
jgi:hypothetical protein